jgi:cis-L-3-hydroxyproline dehydratase
VGITPEAPSLEAATQGCAPALSVDLSLEDLAAARRELDTVQGEALDLVTAGCPHLSLEEWRRLAALLEGRRAHPGVTFLVTTGRGVLEAADRAGYLAALEAFGGRVMVDTCPLASPMLPPEVRQVMTNSGKHAYYAPGLLGTRVALGSLADCVRSAEAGRIVREEPAWTM